MELKGDRPRFPGQHSSPCLLSCTCGQKPRGNWALLFHLPRPLGPSGPGSGHLGVVQGQGESDSRGSSEPKRQTQPRPPFFNLLSCRQTWSRFRLCLVYMTLL